MSLARATRWQAVERGGLELPGLCREGDGIIAGRGRGELCGGILYGLNCRIDRTGGLARAQDRTVAE